MRITSYEPIPDGKAPECKKKPEQSLTNEIQIAIPQQTYQAGAAAGVSNDSIDNSNLKLPREILEKILSFCDAETYAKVMYLNDDFFYVACEALMVPEYSDVSRKLRLLTIQAVFNREVQALEKSKKSRNIRQNYWGYRSPLNAGLSILTNCVTIGTIALESLIIANLLKKIPGGNLLTVLKLLNVGIVNLGLFFAGNAVFLKNGFVYNKKEAPPNAARHITLHTIYLIKALIDETITLGTGWFLLLLVDCPAAVSALAALYAANALINSYLIGSEKSYANQIADQEKRYEVLCSLSTDRTLQRAYLQDPRNYSPDKFLPGRTYGPAKAKLSLLTGGLATFFPIYGISLFTQILFFEVVPPSLLLPASLAVMAAPEWFVTIRHSNPSRFNVRDTARADLLVAGLDAALFSLMVWFSMVNGTENLMPIISCVLASLLTASRAGLSISQFWKPAPIKSPPQLKDIMQEPVVIADELIDTLPSRFFHFRSSL